MKTIGDVMKRARRVRFHLRTARKNTLYAVQVLLGGGPKIDTVVTPPEGPQHPIELCKCTCGPDALPKDHDAGCLWLAQMCRTCGGDGWCPKCGGDGTALAPQAPECPEKGRCHGSLSWCDICGNVSLQCDMADCDVHRERRRDSREEAAYLIGVVYEDLPKIPATLMEHLRRAHVYKDSSKDPWYVDQGHMWVKLEPMAAIDAHKELVHFGCSVLVKDPLPTKRPPHGDPCTHCRGEEDRFGMRCNPMLPRSTRYAQALIQGLVAAGAEPQPAARGEDTVIPIDVHNLIRELRAQIAKLTDERDDANKVAYIIGEEAQQIKARLAAAVNLAGIKAGRDAELIELLEQAGMGAPGTPNNLVDMVKECIGKICPHTEDKGWFKS